MAKLSYILSNRRFEHRVFWDLVREWEDELARTLSVPILLMHSESYLYDVLANKWVRRIFRRFKFTRRWLLPRGLKIRFEMQPELPPIRPLPEFGVHCDEDQIIPWIIDCIFTEEDICDFDAEYRAYPMVLLSSKKSYDLLVERNACPNVKIAHCALSINDKYRVTEDTHFVKTYDVVLAGRQESILLDYLKRYMDSHPSLNVVQRKECSGKMQYVTSNGYELGDMQTRDEFIGLLKKARVVFYSTPHSHKEYHLTQDFVTPRVLEYMASGCHIMAMYPDNSDVQYYRLPEIIPSITSYEQFANQMDYALTHEVDMKIYAEYLERHYTSQRAEELKHLLTRL